MDWKELQQETTADLIEYIRYKDQEGYKELAETAFIAFTFRFSPEIIDRCRKTGRQRSYDRETSDLIAERCFDRFWKYPFGFEKAKCGTLDIEKCVLLYLFRIARNCFYDYDKEISGDESPYDGTESVIVEFPGIEQLDIPEEDVKDLKRIHDIMEKALSTLSPKHKIIYLTYKAFEKKGFKLPRPLLKKLREELDLTQDSIRVYKSEAFKTVDEHKKMYRTE